MKEIIEKVTYPKVIDLRINAECHFDCKYCYGPKLMKKLSFKELQEIIQKFKKLGCEQIVITGGEPLMRNDIIQILELINSLDIKVSVSTTGKLFFKYINQINRYVQHVGLPVDFDDNSFSYRHSDSLQCVLDILTYYKDKFPRPIIKIGTVCTRDNLNKLASIGNLISKYSESIDIWKIYQFIPIGKNAVNNRKKLEISSEEFSRALDGIEDNFAKYFSIAVSPREKRASAYFMVNPNGDVFVPQDDGVNCSEDVIGNLVYDDWNNIFLKWSQNISMNNYKDNIKSTFKLTLK